MEITLTSIIRILCIMIAYLFLRFLYFNFAQKQWRLMQDFYLDMKSGLKFSDPIAYEDLQTKVNSLHFTWQYFWYLFQYFKPEKNVNIPFGRVYLWQDIIDVWKEHN